PAARCRSDRWWPFRPALPRRPRSGNGYWEWDSAPRPGPRRQTMRAVRRGQWREWPCAWWVSWSWFGWLLLRMQRSHLCRGDGVGVLVAEMRAHVVDHLGDLFVAELGVFEEAVLRGVVHFK